MDKHELRKELLERRSALAPAERAELSDRAQAALIGSPAFARARRILLYAPFRGEAGTERIAAAAMAAGKRLALPRVIKEPRGLVLHAYSGDADSLAAGAYGIREPRPDWPEVAPGAVDLVVVPGVGFDRAGNRLGYGGGYYDRLLPMIRAANPRAVLVGLAYSCQVVAGLPSDPHDIPMDGLATDTGFLLMRGDVSMPWRFQEALDLALADLQQQDGVEGILLFGSALTGTDGPTSDLDLYVIMAGDGDQPHISVRRYAGVEAEVHCASRRFWQERMEAGRVVILHAFATGQALLDTTGVVAELGALARRKVAEGPAALTPFEVDQWRYRLTDLADDLEDVAGQPADERLLGALLVTRCLEAYCALNRLWGDKPKRLLAYVERHDPELGRMARVFFAGAMDRHLAHTLVDRVLAPHGGRIGVWDSSTDAPGGHA